MTARAKAPIQSKAPARRRRAERTAPLPQAVPAASQPGPLPAAPQPIARQDPANAAGEELCFELVDLLSDPAEWDRAAESGVVLEIDLPVAEWVIEEVFADLDRICRDGSEREAALAREFQRRVARLRARVAVGEISAAEQETALFRIESETVNRDTPEQGAAVWAREFSVRLKTALAAVKRGDHEAGVVSLAGLLRTILSPTEGASSGLAALARGMSDAKRADRARVGSGRRAKGRPARIGPAERAAILRAVAELRSEPGNLVRSAIDTARVVLKRAPKKGGPLASIADLHEETVARIIRAADRKESSTKG